MIQLLLLKTKSHNYRGEGGDIDEVLVILFCTVVSMCRGAGSFG